MFQCDAKILGWFMESGVWFGGKELPPQRTNIILIGDRPSFDYDKCGDEDDVPVLSEEGNWYTIKKKEIHLL